LLFGTEARGVCFGLFCGHNPRQPAFSPFFHRILALALLKKETDAVTTGN